MFGKRILAFYFLFLGLFAIFQPLASHSQSDRSELPKCGESEWFAKDQLIGTIKSEYRKKDGSIEKRTAQFFMRSVFGGQDTPPDHLFIPLAPRLAGQLSSNSIRLRIAVGPWSELYKISSKNKVDSAYLIEGFRFSEAWQRTIPSQEKDEESGVHIASEPIRFILERNQKPLCEHQISVTFSE